jgi:hypothetical protein
LAIADGATEPSRHTVNTNCLKRIEDTRLPSISPRLVAGREGEIDKAIERAEISHRSLDAEGRSR